MHQIVGKELVLPRPYRIVFVIGLHFASDVRVNVHFFLDSRHREGKELVQWLLGDGLFDLLFRRLFLPEGNQIHQVYRRYYLLSFGYFWEPH